MISISDLQQRMLEAFSWASRDSFSNTIGRGNGARSSAGKHSKNRDLIHRMARSSLATKYHVLYLSYKAMYPKFPGYVTKNEVWLPLTRYSPLDFTCSVHSCIRGWNSTLIVNASGGPQHGHAYSMRTQIHTRREMACLYAYLDAFPTPLYHVRLSSAVFFCSFKQCSKRQMSILSQSSSLSSSARSVTCASIPTQLRVCTCTLFAIFLHLVVTASGSSNAQEQSLR
jgi:hypothetical protein